MTTIVLSAGGTGGHLFPAQALATELARRGKSIVVMTDRRGRNYTSAFPDAIIETVPAATFADRSIAARLTAPFEIFAGVVMAFAKLRRIRPVAVVGFGGYPSLPVMLAAWLGNFPTAILAPDTVLGRVNRLLADRMRVVAATFPFARFAPKDSSKTVFTGTPVRPEIIAHAASPYDPPRADGPLHLLVFGGSQGAHILSEVVPAAIALLPDAMRARLSIVQQCRAEDLDAVRVAYAECGVRAELASFFTDMPARMAQAQLVIARSGASTLCELAVIGRPALFIPLPSATDDHQTSNADVFAHAGAAWRVAQREFTPQSLAQMLSEIFAQPEELAKRAAATRQFAKPDAASRLADLVEKLGEAA
jgi:UDP-N-acetylglucosamine--N-acetylmuramyl-(pentapeptide) pyrophosphoryl-undecaprenol N-acetylglucosamine transferase